ncbi:hypothetical protein JYT51_01200 [Candidatus Amoebophilus asiaticus]|nr:hypothetical protein [Candidatus Amoebophilus asiaticus]
MKLTLLVTLCITNAICYSQNSVIENIRNHYKEISDLIEKCRKEKECDLYQNTIEINSMNGSWRGVGTYSKNITFWYNDDPKLCDECGENGIEVLRKIEIEEWSGVYKFNYELIFDKGSIIFYYLKNTNEYRYYFKESMLIKCMENSEIITKDKIQNSTIEKIKKQGRSLQQLFLLCHQ